MATLTEQAQFDVLATDLTNNPLMQPSPISARDNSLKTSAKKVIKAINEVLGIVKINETANKTFIDETNTRITDMQNTVDDNNTKVTKMDKKITETTNKITKIDNTYAAINNNLTNINSSINTVSKKIDNLPSSSGGSNNVIKSNILECTYDYEILEEVKGYKYAKYTLSGYDESMGIPNRILIYLVKDKSTSFLTQFMFLASSLQSAIHNDCICDSHNGEIAISKSIGKDGKVEYFLQNINFTYMKYFWQNNQSFNKFIQKGFITRFACGSIDLHSFEKYTDTDLTSIYRNSIDNGDNLNKLSKYIVKLVF